MIRLGFLTLLSCLALLAETPPQYHFLVVVDSSQSMLARKPAAVKAVRELVRSGFAGQAAERDAFDVWTFASELRAAQFPPQVWMPARSNLLAEIPAQFLNAEKFQGRTRFRNVSEQLNAWIAHQTHALLFLLTDGDDPILGLPFDLEMNEEIARQKRSLRGAKKVFLVSMLVQNGRAIEWRVQFGDQPLNLPQLPARVSEKPVLASAAPTTSDQTAAPEPEPLVVLDLPPGSKVTPISIAQPAAEASVQPAPEPPPRETSKTAEVVVEATLQPAPAVTEIPQPTPVPPVVSEPIISEVKIETPVAPKVEPMVIAEEKTISTAPNNPTPVPPIPVSVVTPASRKPIHFALAGGVALLLLAFVFLRRKPKGPAASLISKSLNQQ